MGIHDLFVLIKSECLEQLMDLHLSELRGRSLACDISIFLNKFIKSSGERLWMNSFFNFFCCLKKYGIKAVCIFDGPNPPPEKKAEQNSRKAQTEKAKGRLCKAIKLKNLIMSNYIPHDVLLPVELQDECKSVLVVGNQNKCKNVDWNECTDVYEALKELINRLDIQTTPITNEQREKAWQITKMMGLASYQADGEAEALCAYLAIHGYVDAVFSEDSDVLAYGCPFMVCYKDYKLSDDKVKVIHLPSLLEALELSEEEFRDLCILLGCDYNHRIKGYPPDGKKYKKPVCIGWKKALCMINEYRTLEECEPYIEDISPLIYERCRELFTPINTEEMRKLIEVEPYNEPPDIAAIKIFLQQEGLYDITDRIVECWKPANLIFIDSDSEESLVEDTANDIEDGIVCEEEIVIKKDSRFYAKLCAECDNGEGNERSFNFYVSFENEEKFTEANDSGYDDYLEIFNKWIDEQVPGGSNYYIDDCVECEKTLKKKPINQKILKL
jgi:flap endonuclease-1